MNLPTESSMRRCPECGHVGRGPICHHWDATGERKVPTEHMEALRARVAELEQEKAWNESWAGLDYDLVRTLAQERDEAWAEVERLRGGHA